jgi:hypothetical protein
MCCHRSLVSRIETLFLEIAISTYKKFIGTKDTKKMSIPEELYQLSL